MWKLHALMALGGALFAGGAISLAEKGPWWLTGSLFAAGVLLEATGLYLHWKRLSARDAE